MIKSSFGDRYIYLVCDKCRGIHDRVSMTLDAQQVTEFLDCYTGAYVCWRHRPENEDKQGRIICPT